MGSTGITPSPSGEWTRLYRGPATGLLKVSTDAPGQAVKWKVVTFNIPFYFEGTAFVRSSTPILFGLPTPFVNFYLMPSAGGLFQAS